MLKSLRTALTAAGGAQVLIALGAIAWGLGRLQSIAEERQAQIDQLDTSLAERAEALHAAVRADAPEATHDQEETPQS